MKKKFKFRAWDNLTKKMIYFSLLNSCGMCPPDCLNSVMQFIGHEDCNDKEIYEGDVMFDTAQDIDCYETVVWFKEKCSFGFKNQIGYIRNVPVKSIHQYRIVGNIYQNKIYDKN